MTKKKSPKQNILLDFSGYIFYSMGIFLLSFIPSLIFSLIVIFAWAYHHTDDLSNEGKAAFVFTAVLFSFSACGSFALQNLIIKTYHKIYIAYIKTWIPPFAKQLTSLVYDKKDNLNKEISEKIILESSEGKDYLDIEEKAFAWLNAKIYALPPSIARIVAFVLKLTPIGDFILFIDTSFAKKESSKEDLSIKLESKIDLTLKNLPKKVFPLWFKVIFLLNILFIIILIFTLKL